MQQRRVVPQHNRPNSKRKKQKQNQNRFVGFLLLVLLLILIWFLLDTMIALGIGKPSFYNVYVNGIRMRGYTYEEGSQLFESLESDWINQSYEVYAGDKTWTFTPSMIGADLNENGALQRAWNFGHIGNIFTRKAQIKSLKNEPEYFVSEITYDEALMDNFIQTLQQEIDIEPVDAIVVLDVNAPRVEQQSSNGAALDVEETLALLKNLLLVGSNGDRAELPVEVLVPSISTDDISGSLSVIVEYSTSIDGSRSNRKYNVKKALSFFNSMEIAPGVEISFNEVVGARSKARGFKEAIEYSEGESITGYGGGTCQASTTLYGALLKAGMTIVRRSNHSMTVAYVKPSLDAAVTDTSSKDLVFRNDTENSIYLYTSGTDSTVTVTIYGSRPAFRYEFWSNVLEKNIAGTSEKTRVDTTGEYATYTDERVLGTQGKPGLRSEGWLISYDWNSGEEVSRQKLSTDYYKPGLTIYYIGTQERVGALATQTPW